MTSNPPDNGPVADLRGEVHDEATVQVAEVAKATTDRFWRRNFAQVVAACAFVALLVAAAVSVAIVPLYVRTEQTQASVSEVRQLAEDAQAQGQAANKTLADRGQATVPIPQPGNSTDSDVLVAAATARVLASLPDTRPTASQLGEAIARYVAGNPSAVGPSPQQIAASLAGYLATNPPAPGKDGKDGKNGSDGQPGRPPTAEEIAAAVQAYCNPPGQPSPCRGPQGRGVTKSQVVDCRWRVTYTDGTTEDAGNACTTETKTVTPTTTTAPFIPTP